MNIFFDIQYQLEFTDKTQLILTEYLAYKDAGTFVILKELTENYMNIALGIHTEPSIIYKPTLLFHMSLTAELSQIKVINHLRHGICIFALLKKEVH